LFSLHPHADAERVLGDKRNLRKKEQTMYFKPKSGLWFAASTDNATGTGGQEQAAQSNGGSGDPQATPPTQAKPPITFESEEKLQAYIDDKLKERLERAQRSADKKAQEAREQAAADAAAKNGEWQKLAESREGKIKELSAQVETITSLQEKADKYEKALKAHLDTQRTGLPAHVLVLLDKLDPVEQLEYIAKNHDALAAPAQKRSNGVPPTPPAGDLGELTAEEQQRAREEQRRHMRSNF
jgi:hypothetical protein